MNMYVYTDSISLRDMAKQGVITHMLKSSLMQFHARSELISLIPSVD